MKQRHHQSLSAGGIELPLLFTLMGNPHGDTLAHLIKCSEPRRQIICTKGTSLNENKKNIQTRTGTICIVIKRAAKCFESMWGFHCCGTSAVKMRTCQLSRLLQRRAPLWQMCLTTDSSNHERWQCCGRRQFLQMVKNIPNLTSTCMCCKPTLHIEKQLNWLKQVVKVRLVYVHKKLQYVLFFLYLSLVIGGAIPSSAVRWRQRQGYVFCLLLQPHGNISYSLEMTPLPFTPRAFCSDPSWICKHELTS